MQDVLSSKDLLRREGQCFLWLSVGHKVGLSTSSRCCKSCNRQHHQSICDALDNSPPQIPPTMNNTLPLIPQTITRDSSIQSIQNIETTRTNATRSRIAILLQTAKAWAYNVSV